MASILSQPQCEYKVSHGTSHEGSVGDFLCFAFVGPVKDKLDLMVRHINLSEIVQINRSISAGMLSM